MGRKPHKIRVTMPAFTRDAVAVGWEVSEVFGVAWRQPARPLGFWVILAVPPSVRSLAARLDLLGQPVVHFGFDPAYGSSA